MIKKLWLQFIEKSNISLNRVCVPSRKIYFPVDWRLLVKERITNIGIALDVLVFLLFLSEGLLLWLLALVTGVIQHATCDMWHMAHDTWHMICDTGHLTYDIFFSTLFLFMSVLVLVLLSAHIVREQWPKSASHEAIHTFMLIKF